MQDFIRQSRISSATGVKASAICWFIPLTARLLRAQKAWPRTGTSSLTAVRQLPRIGLQQDLSSHSPHRSKVPSLSRDVVEQKSPWT
jgi:hypothetical protein